MIDLYTAEFSTLTNDQRHAAIADFAEAQPNESNRHDYKRIWNNDSVKDVAALANTFGGLLIIGVEKGPNDSHAKLVGVESNSEISTGIASAIATNISPTPTYDVMECQEPGEANKRFCVVRVRNDFILHLVTKKGMPPVWVRNADQTIPADAAQLRMLIDRERQSTADTEQSLLERAGHILEEMIIGYDYPDKPDWTGPGPWQRSETYFKLALVPAEKRRLRLDVREERKLTSLIHSRYRRTVSNLGGADAVARDAPNRSADFFEYRWYHRKLAYESRWRITNQVEIAQATQISYEKQWSLVDVVTYTILFLMLSAEWWKVFTYFGDAILLAELNVGVLSLARGKSDQFLKLFGPGEGDYGMRAEVLEVHRRQRTESKAYITINSATLLDSIPRIVTSLMNPLLRTLGHAVHWEGFEDNVRLITEGQFAGSAPVRRAVF